ncbi:hypothetical protein HKX48_003205 [Thoreauomyces humboldtii]|nr:hypothetical protein HKX48_003205 [Thoreauomyces humboldtii]
MVVEQGTPDAARALNAVPFNALMEAHCRAGNMDEAQKVMVQMHAMGISPTAQTYTILISACSVDQISTALAILDVMIESSMRPSLSLLNSVLDLCFRAPSSEHRRQASKVFAVLQRLYPSKKGNRTGPNATTACILLRQCVADGEVESVFRDIKNWGLVRSPLVQEELLRTAARIRAPLPVLPRCLDWANRFAEMGVLLSPEAVNVMLQAYATDGAVVEGIGFAERMRDVGGPAHDGVRTLLRNQAGVAPKEKQAIARRVWNDMKRRSEAPTVRTFIDIIDAMGREGDAAGLAYLHNLMMSKAPRSSSSTVEAQDVKESLTSDEELSLLARIDPSDPRLHRAFLAAFSHPRTADPIAAARVFASSPTTPTERTLLSLLSSIHTRREAAPLLNHLLAAAVRRQAPLTTTALTAAFEGIVERVGQDDAPMAFSSGLVRGVGHVGRRAELARGAVVRAAAKGVASAAESVRLGSDVEAAVKGLEEWVLDDGSKDVDGALEALEVSTFKGHDEK